MGNFEHFQDLGAKNKRSQTSTQFQVRKQGFSKKNFTKNRYLLVLGAKTTGAKHRTFSKDFLIRLPHPHWALSGRRDRNRPQETWMNALPVNTPPQSTSTKRWSLENRDYVLTIVKLLLSKTKPLNTIAKHNTYQTIINHHFTDRHLHQKNDLVIFETPRLSNCFVINFAKTHIWKGKRIWSLIKN